MDGEKLSEFEKERLERVQRNRERLLALEIPDLVPPPRHPQPKRKPSTVSKAAKKKRGPEVPLRRSSRVAGLVAEGNQIESEEGGKIVVSHEPKPEELGPKERHPQSDVHLFDGIESEYETRYLRELGRYCSKNGPPSTAPSGSLEWLRTCSLSESDVAKVLPSSCVHLRFHPTTDTLLLAAGDKYGNLALWHHDSKVFDKISSGLGKTKSELDQGSSEDDEDNIFDGVMRLNYHREYISGLQWAGSGVHHLFTSSYDGSFRQFDPLTGVARLVVSSEDIDFSAMHVSADGRTAVLGTKMGDAALVDCRSRNPKQALKLMDFHNRKVNTIRMHPSNEQIIVTSSTDATIKLWDIRKLGGHHKASPIGEASHKQGCQAADFAPDGSHRIVSTSFDNTLMVWDAAECITGKKGGTVRSIQTIQHDNNTGRWILPFRAIWAPGGDAVLVGNMKRAVDVIDPQRGRTVFALRSEFMTAIPSRNAVHPTLPVLAAATASGRIHLWR